MPSKKRQYWLGKKNPSSQDTFFLEALDNELWEPGDKNNWDTCWQTSMPDRQVFTQLTDHKTINHIPGNSALTIKSNLYHTLLNAKERLSGLPQADKYDFFPLTFSMPEDYHAFQATAAQNPEWMWIQKPKNMSRGRGIEMVQHPESIPMDDEWIIQRYIDNPHLYNGHKYVMRCYALITSVEPLRCYWYAEGSVKLASEAYISDDLDNPYRHLTNPDINEDNHEADIPVIFIPFADYKQWLKSEGVDDKKLFEELEELIGLSIIAARETLRKQCHVSETNTQGCYELIGLDCTIDDQLKPWILECNLSPSLEVCTEDNGGGQAETTTKKALVNDIVNMMGLNHPQFGSLTTEDKTQIEIENSGGFKHIFPSEKAAHYAPFFPIPRYADIIAMKSYATPEQLKLHTQPLTGSSHAVADSLVLLAPALNRQSEHFITPNDLGAWVWLKIEEGLSPETIINELKTLSSAETGTLTEEANNRISQQVWDLLADWAQAGLFIDNPTAQSKGQKKNTNHETKELTIESFGITTILTIDCETAYNYLKDDSSIQEFTYKKINTDNEKTNTKIRITPSNPGYMITATAAQHVILSDYCKLSEITSVILQHKIKEQLSNEGIAYLHGFVANFNDLNYFITSNQEDDLMTSFELIEKDEGIHIISGPIFLSNENKITRTSNLPIKSSIKTNLTYKSSNKSNDEKTVLIHKMIHLNNDSKEKASPYRMNGTETISKITSSHESIIHQPLFFLDWVNNIESWTAEPTESINIIK